MSRPCINALRVCTDVGFHNEPNKNIHIHTNANGLDKGLSKELKNWNSYLIH